MATRATPSPMRKIMPRIINQMATIRQFFSKGNSRSLSVKKNIIGSMAIKCISILVQLMLVPLTLGYLSADLYGIWLTVSSIMLWLNFFDVGFTLGLKNRLAEAIAVGDYRRGKSLVSTTYIMLILIFVPVGLIGELVIPHIDWSGFLNVSSEYNLQLVEVMRILLISFCLQMIFNAVSAILAAFQKVAFSSVFPVLGNILSLIVIFILKYTVPPSLPALAISISYLPVAVYLVCSVILFNGVLKKVSPSLRSIDFSYVKDLFQLGVKFFIIQIQIVVLYQSTNILISNLSSPLDVTSYNIAYRYIGVASMLFTLILNPLWPAFTDAYAKRDFPWMKQVYRRMKKLYSLLFVAIVLMGVLSPIVYKLWIGDRAAIPIAMTCSVCLYVAISMWSGLHVYLINGIGAVTLQTYVTLIGLIFHIPLSIFLGRYIGLGALGVVSSMCIINAIYTIVFTVQLRKILSGNASPVWLK